MADGAAGSVLVHAADVVQQRRHPQHVQVRPFHPADAFAEAEHSQGVVPGMAAARPH